MKNLIISFLLLTSLIVNAQFTQHEYRLNGNVKSVTDSIFFTLKGKNITPSIEKLTFTTNGFLQSKSITKDNVTFTKNYIQKNDTLFEVQQVLKGKNVRTTEYKVYKPIYQKEIIEYNYTKRKKRLFERKTIYNTPDSISIFTKIYYPKQKRIEAINTQEVYKNALSSLRQKITYQKDGFIDKDTMVYSKYDRPYRNWTYASSKTFDSDEQGRLYIKRTITYHNTQKCCPICHKSDKIIRVIYGKPSKALIDRAKKGEVALGGCVRIGKKHYCKRDKISF